MRKELQEIESIENYLLGKMSHQEKADFEKELSSNSELKQKVEIQESLAAGLERIGLKQEMVKAKQTLFLRKVGAWVAAGLVITVLIFGSFGLVNENFNGIKDEGLKIKESSTESKMQRTLSDSTLRQKLSASSKENSIEMEVAAKMKNSKINNVKLPIKEFQTFILDPTKPTTITGNEGTVIEFKTNSFDTKSDELVTIKLKEYYNMNDIAFSNLTTQTADGAIIETGGMVFLEASQPSKKELQLLADKPITLKFPSKNKKEGMQTFLGSEDESGKVIWEVEDLNLEADFGFEEETFSQPLEVIQDAEIFTIVEDMPVFKGCETEKNRALKNRCSEQKISEFIEKSIKMPSNAIMNGVNGTSYVNFLVNESGIVEDVKVVRSLNPILDQVAIEAIYDLPQFTPGQQRGNLVKVQYSVPVKFKIEGSYNFSEEAYSKFMKESARKVKKRKEIALEILIEDTLPTSKNEQRVKQSSLDYYVLSSRSLSWINCDRFNLAAKERITLSVMEKNRDAKIKLIFKSISSVMRANVGVSRHSFTRIPKDEEVVLFASKFIDDKLYIAIDELKTKNEIRTLDYKLATKELIENYSDILNQKPLN